MAHHASIDLQVRSNRFTQSGRKSGTIHKPRKLLRWNTQAKTWGRRFESCSWLSFVSWLVDRPIPKGRKLQRSVLSAG